MPNRIPDPRAGGPEGNRLPGAVSINRPSAEKVGAANTPTTAPPAHGAPAHPTAHLLVDDSQTDIRLPRAPTGTRLIVPRRT